VGTRTIVVTHLRRLNLANVRCFFKRATRVRPIRIPLFRPARSVGPLRSLIESRRDRKSAEHRAQITLVTIEIEVSDIVAKSKCLDQRLHLPRQFEWPDRHR
jgi:hypothetical protein